MCPPFVFIVYYLPTFTSVIDYLRHVSSFYDRIHENIWKNNVWGPTMMNHHIFINFIYIFMIFADFPIYFFLFFLLENQDEFNFGTL